MSRQQVTAMLPCCSWVDPSPWTTTWFPSVSPPKTSQSGSCCWFATTPSPAGARGPPGATLGPLEPRPPHRCPPSSVRCLCPSSRTPSAPRKPSSTSPVTCCVLDTWRAARTVAVETTGALWWQCMAPPTSWQVWSAGGGAVHTLGIMGCTPTWPTMWTGWRPPWKSSLP